MFNICDVSSWNEATDNEFQWKGENTFFDEANGKNISEKIMVLQMETILSALKQSVPEDSIQKFGISKIVECVLDNFLKGKSPKEIFPVLIIMVEKGFSFNTAEEIMQKYGNNNENEALTVTENKKNNILEETSWKNISISEYEGHVFGVLEIYLFCGEGKLIRNVVSATIPPLQNGTTHNQYVDPWELNDDKLKIMFGDTLFEAKYLQKEQKIFGTKIFSDGKTKEETWTPYNDSDTEIFKQMLIDAKRNMQSNFYQNEQDNALSFNLTKPSPLLLVFGIGAIIGGLGYLFMNLNTRFYSPDISKLIISFIIMMCSIPFFVKYGKDQNRYHYHSVCYSMSQWVGSSANELIMKWGAPTKTYKFPTDKTMTVLEYKDSIRNYVGVRTRISKGVSVMGMQAKTTKYIKSFFVKDDRIIDYKYAIT